MAGQRSEAEQGRRGAGGAADVREVVIARDEFGAPFAVEVIDAASWRAELLEPPAAEEADVRIVRLRRGRAPVEVPSWLHVETRSERVAEAGAGYATGGEAGSPHQRDLVMASRLWHASERYREPGPPLAEFMTAGAVAVLHPRPVPTGQVRQRAAVEAFVAGRSGALGVTATVQGDARERWLRYAFEVPDRFADAILLARLDDAGQGAVTSLLRYLREAEVDAWGANEGVLAELMFDRRALLNMASPWRHLEELASNQGPGSASTGALAAVRAWRGRYRVAYASHYAAVVREAVEARRELRAASGAAEALRRLDAMRALGTAVGGAALAAYASARDGLAALPTRPDAEAARTGVVMLGAPLPLIAQASAAIEAVRAALEQQRVRLASRATHLVLAREDVPALDRLLQALAASDLDGLERALDARLAEHIEALLVA